MFANYLKLALRHMRRRPEFAAVNLAGLAIGLAACVLAVLFVQDEFAYDRFHSHVERIFEVRSEIGTGDDVLTLTTGGPIGPALASGFPEVEAATRLTKAEVVVRKDDQAILRNGLGVDPSFFAVFSFPLAKGDASSALGDPYSVILGRETARQLFGSKDPMGRTLSMKIGDETARPHGRQRSPVPGLCSKCEFQYHEIKQKKVESSCGDRLRWPFGRFVPIWRDRQTALMTAAGG